MNQQDIELQESIDDLARRYGSDCKEERAFYFKDTNDFVDQIIALISIRDQAKKQELLGKLPEKQPMLPTPTSLFAGQWVVKKTSLLLQEVVNEILDQVVRVIEETL